MRPKHIPRIAVRDMVAIVRESIGEPCHVTVDDDGTVCARRSERHEEGWSSRTVVVTPSDDGSRRYDVEITDDGRDCDGRLTQSRSLVATPRGKRRRIYIGADYSRIVRLPDGRERFAHAGRFDMRSRYAYRVEDERQRDEYAEAAGY